MANSPDLAQDITELQAQLAFQDDTVQTLNDIVARQQVQIDKLQRDIESLLLQVQQLGDALRGSPAEEPPPPHY